jgi:hypothetical protein
MSKFIQTVHYYNILICNNLIRYLSKKDAEIWTNGLQL